MKEDYEIYKEAIYEETFQTETGQTKSKIVIDINKQI